MFSIDLRGVGGVIATIIVVFGILWAIIYKSAPQLPPELQQFAYGLAGIFFWIWFIPFIVAIAIFVLKELFAH